MIRAYPVVSARAVSAGCSWANRPDPLLPNGRRSRPYASADPSANPAKFTMDAARRWAFTPTLLNGDPVPVVMTVTVAFTLR